MGNMFSDIQAEKEAAEMAALRIRLDADTARLKEYEAQQQKAKFEAAQTPQTPQAQVPTEETAKAKRGRPKKDA